MKRALLIEDEPLVASWFSTLLAAEGVTAYAVGTLAEARLVQKARVDFILLDLNLPDSEGITTVERVRDIFPELPVVVVSGGVDSNMAEKAISCGAVGVLSKPTMTAKSLMDAVAVAMQAKAVAKYPKLQRELECVRAEAVGLKMR